MKVEQFIQKNEDIWRELEELSMQINKKGFKKLPSHKTERFLQLFRQCSHHLAYSRTHYPGSSVEKYLNSLVGKCHSRIYAVKIMPIKQILRYFAYDFPKLLKDNKAIVLLSFGFFAVGMLLSFILVTLNPDNASFFLPQSFIDGVKQSSGNSAAEQWNYPLMSSAIMTNNISVSLKAFAYGITLGIGTIYLLYSNGALLGALTALMYMYGDTTRYWSLILPHGIIELTAIFISGAAGLIIAKSMLLPGELNRRHSLINGSKIAVSAVAGIILMLIIAGIIEGFFTPLNISPSIKLIFAAVTAVILILYFSIPYIVRKRSNAF